MPRSDDYAGVRGGQGRSGRGLAFEAMLIAGAIVAAGLLVLIGLVMEGM